MAENIDEFRLAWLAEARKRLIDADPASAEPKEFLYLNALLKAYDFADAYEGVTPNRLNMIMSMTADDLEAWLAGDPENLDLLQLALEDAKSGAILFDKYSVTIAIAGSPKAITVLHRNDVLVTRYYSHDPFIAALAAYNASIAQTFTAAKATRALTELMLSTVSGSNTIFSTPGFFAQLTSANVTPWKESLNDTRITQAVMKKFMSDGFVQAVFSNTYGDYSPWTNALFNTTAVTAAKRDAFFAAPGALITSKADLDFTWDNVFSDTASYDLALYSALKVTQWKVKFFSNARVLNAVVKGTDTYQIPFSRVLGNNVTDAQFTTLRNTICNNPTYFALRSQPNAKAGQPWIRDGFQLPIRTLANDQFSVSFTYNSYTPVSDTNFYAYGYPGMASQSGYRPRRIVELANPFHPNSSGSSIRSLPANPTDLYPADATGDGFAAWILWEFGCFNRNGPTSSDPPSPVLVGASFWLGDETNQTSSTSSGYGSLNSTSVVNAMIAPPSYRSYYGATGYNYRRTFYSSPHIILVDLFVVRLNGATSTSYGVRLEQIGGGYDPGTTGATADRKMSADIARHTPLTIMGANSSGDVNTIGYQTGAVIVGENRKATDAYAGTTASTTDYFVGKANRYVGLGAVVAAPVVAGSNMSSIPTSVSTVYTQWIAAAWEAI
jgi:hypothetical protein